MNLLSKKFWDDVQTIYGVGSSTRRLESVARQILVERIVKGYGGVYLNPNNGRMTREEHRVIQYSEFTCGCAEIGRVYPAMDKKRILDGLLLAVIFKKGKISFHMPCDPDREKNLREYGFLPHGPDFYNPNSGNRVQEYVVYNDPTAVNVP